MFKSEITKRSIFSVLFVLLFVPSFVLSQIGGQGGRIFSLITYLFVGAIAFYEIMRVLGLNYKVAALSSLLILLFTLFPYRDFESLVNNGEANAPLIDIINGKVGYLYFYAKAAIGSWQPWVITIAASFIPLLFLKLSFSERVKRQTILTFSALVIGSLINLLWAYNIRGFIYLLFFILIPIIADTFGYFGGFFFGKKMFKGKKMAPSISPSKTWAGYFFAITGSSIFSIIAGYYLHIWDIFAANELAISIIYGLILPQIAVIGDLTFSLIKRKIGIKDFSNILPGHGGIMDRLDSISFVFIASGLLFLPAGLSI